MEQEVISSLFVEELRMQRPVPRESYLYRLPVVRNLTKQGGIRLNSCLLYTSRSAHCPYLPEEKSAHRAPHHADTQAAVPVDC